MRRLLLAFAFAIACSGAAPSVQPAAVDARPASSGSRVLFIGNSLTASNDLPGMVAALSNAAEVPLVIDAVVLPGASIGDHLDEGTARRRLEAERWDFVVLQQGPTSRTSSRAVFRADAARIAPLIRAAGARAALYMVWPVQSEPEHFDGVHESYATVARDLGGIFLPAGEAWRAAWRHDAQLALYSPDGLHPTRAGSYAAALVIFGGLTGRSPIGAPALAGIDAATAEALQRAADEALRSRP